MRARQTQARTESLGEPEEAQPEAFHNPGAGGTCIPGDQAAVWIHPDPLPRADEECRPGEHADGLGQPIPAAQATADYLRRNPLKMPRRQTMKHKQGESGGKMLPKNELPGIRV